MSEVLRVVSGRTGLEKDGERASVGEMLAKECRIGNAGLALLEFGNSKLLVDGDPARDNVIDSCCMGISNDAVLGPNVGCARSVGVNGIDVPGSS